LFGCEICSLCVQGSHGRHLSHHHHSPSSSSTLTTIIIINPHHHQWSSSSPPSSISLKVSFVKQSLSLFFFLSGNLQFGKCDEERRGALIQCGKGEREKKEGAGNDVGTSSSCCICTYDTEKSRASSVAFKCTTKIDRSIVYCVLCIVYCACLRVNAR
jgi:hypothetical protein